MDEYDECIVRVENIPTSVNGFCYHDDEGRSFIVLNARQTRENNRDAYRHEVTHIRRGDMYDKNYREYN